MALLSIEIPIPILIPQQVYRLQNVVKPKISDFLDFQLWLPLAQWPGGAHYWFSVFLNFFVLGKSLVQMETLFKDFEGEKSILGPKITLESLGFEPATWNSVKFT